MRRRLVLVAVVAALVVGVVQPAAATPTPSEPPPSTPNDAPTTDKPTSDRPATEPTPSTRTAAGNAHRPAGTDPFRRTAVTTDGSGPGFGPVLAALALAALGVLATHRN